MAEPRDTKARAEEILARHAFEIEGGQHAIGDKAKTIPHCSCGWSGPEGEDRQDAHAMFQTHIVMLPPQEYRDRAWAVLILQRVTEFEDM